MDFSSAEACLETAPPLSLPCERTCLLASLPCERTSLLLPLPCERTCLLTLPPCERTSLLTTVALGPIAQSLTSPGPRLTGLGYVQTQPVLCQYCLIGPIGQSLTYQSWLVTFVASRLNLSYACAALPFLVCSAPNKTGALVL